mgnify:CR=1 FL=1
MADAADIEIRFIGDTSDLSDALAEASAGVADLASEMEEVTDAGDGMASSMGASSSGLRGLGSVARLVHPQLGMYASAALGASRATKGFGISLGTLAGALAPIAAVAAVTYGAYKLLTSDAKAAADAQKTLAESSQRVADAMAQTVETSLRAKLVRDEIDQQEYIRQISLLKSSQLFGDLIEEQEALTLAELAHHDALVQALATVDEWNKIGLNVVAVWETLTLPGQIEASRETFQGLAADLAALHAASEQHQIDLVDIATDSEDAAAGTEVLTEAIKELTWAQRLATLEGVEGIKIVDEYRHDSHENVMKRYQAEERFKEEMAKADAERDEIRAASRAVTMKGFEFAAEAGTTLALGLTEDAKALFYIQQALALAEIAFSTSKNITEAFPNPWTIAAASALGLAQAAVVLSQDPPAHMGLTKPRDPLHPDEGMTRILGGEAVLDRATVRRLGGAQGVRELAGGAQGGTVLRVVVPWKHLDRELADGARGHSRLAKSMRRAAVISNGQTGW